MKKEAAISCIQSLKGAHRIAQEDGEDFALTMDFRPDRVNLSVTRGIVKKVTVG
jgi:hypothetical protein